MSIQSLVKFIQENYAEDINPLKTGDSYSAGEEVLNDQLVAGALHNLPAIERPPLPDWLQPGDGEVIGDDDLVDVEGSLPQGVLPQPGNPDVLAYYLPFHFYREEWGIYLRAQGLLDLVVMLVSASSGASISDLLDLAYRLLFQHEHFHFLSEVACSRAEIASRRRLYGQYFVIRQATALEEALANARAYRIGVAGQSNTIKNQVDGWMSSQGPGYCDFKEWLWTQSFSFGSRLISQNMIRLVPYPESNEPHEFLYAGLSRARAPRYLILDNPLIKLFKPFPKDFGMRVEVYAKDHPPPHMHVQIPPGRPFTRLEWPTFEPIERDQRLSKKQQRDFKKYLEKHGKGIESKIRQFWPAA